MKFKELDIATQVILKVIFAILALAFLWWIRDILLIILLALVLASALDPLVEYLNKKRIPRAVSVLAVYIILLGAAATVIYLLIPPLVTQLKVLQSNWPHFANEFQSRLSGTPFADFNLAQTLKDAFSGGGDVVTRTVGVFNGVFSLITVLVLSFYLTAEEKGMKKTISSLVPERHQVKVSDVVDKIQKKMGMWVLGQLILSLAIFIFTFIGLKILGVQYALFLAMLAGLLEIVPYLGPILSSVPAILFAFLQNPPLAIAVALLYVLIQKTENYVLTPKIMEKTVGTSPLVVLVALLVGFKLAGIVGLLIAVPLAGAITVVIEEIFANRQSLEKVV